MLPGCGAYTIKCFGSFSAIFKGYDPDSLLQ